MSQPPRTNNPAPRGVTASDLGSHSTHLCDLRLKLTFSNSAEIPVYFHGADSPEQNLNSALSEKILARGRSFERSLVDRLSQCDQTVLCFKSWERGGVMEDLVGDLRGPVRAHCWGHPGRTFVIHEPMLLPEDLVDTDPVARAFKLMFPDFLFLFWDPARNKMVCVVVDAKCSRVERLSHKTQVGVYQRMLRALVDKNEDLRDVYEVPEIGGVWVPETQHTWLLPMPAGFGLPGPSLFNCDLVQAGLDAFLKRTLDNVRLEDSVEEWKNMLLRAPWRVNGRCSGCQHLPKCSAMAGTGCGSRVTSLPYIKDAEADALVGIVGKGPRATVSDVEDLLRQNHPAAPLLRSLVPPALIEALKTGQPAARAGRYSVSFPKSGVAWGLAVSAYQNPGATKPEPAAWGLQVISLYSARGQDGRLECGWLANKDGGCAAGELAETVTNNVGGQRAFATARELTRALVTALWESFSRLAETDHETSVFLFASKAERALVDSLLLEAALGGEKEDEELADRARDLVMSMTEGSSSIVLGGADILGKDAERTPPPKQAPVPASATLEEKVAAAELALADRRTQQERTKALKALESPHVVVIDDTAREMLHLPSMRGLYTTVGVLTALTGVPEPPCFEATMTAWCDRVPLGPLFAGLFGCVRAAVRRIHEIVPNEALLFSASPLKRVPKIMYRDQALCRLAFVAQWESLTSWRRVFVPRATLPLEEQLQAGIAIKMVPTSQWRDKGKDGRSLRNIEANFRLHDDSRGTRLEAGDLYNTHILSLGAKPSCNLLTRRYVDIFKPKMSGEGAMSVGGCAEVKPDDPNEVVIAILSDRRSEQGARNHFTAGTEVWMFPRFVDWTLDPALESLRAWDMRQASSSSSSPPLAWSPLRFPDLLSDGARAHLARPDNAYTRYRVGGDWSFEEGSERLNGLLETGRSLGLADSQLECLRKLALTRILCLWGPAGSGKTHTLAIILLALAAHTRGAHFKVCVVSSTHNAVDTLLNAVVTLDPGQGALPTAIVGKLVNKKEGTPYGAGEQPGREVRQVAVDELDRFWGFGGGRLSVVGGTLWKATKCLNKDAGRRGLFDLVIVDEASQMPLNHASIAHELVHPTRGRLVVAGDHKQLPPVMVGDYPKVPRGSIDFSSSYLETVVDLLTPLAPEVDGSAGAARAVFADQSAPPPPSDLLCVAKLKENFRMNGAHAKLCARLTYGLDYEARAAVPPARLAETVRAALNPAPEAAITSLVLEVPTADVSRVAAMTPAEAAGLEALVAVQIAKAYLHDRGNLAAAGDKEEVLIITPHHVQRKAVNALLEEHKLPPTAVVANVVEKMQGKTATLVIACLCSFQGLADGEGGGGEGPRGGRSHFFLERQRLNVTLTRAKCKTVLLTTDSVVHFGLDSLRDQDTEDGIRFFRSAMASIPGEYQLKADVHLPPQKRKGRTEIEVESD
jgi:hypothetical protein